MLDHPDRIARLNPCVMQAVAILDATQDDLSTALFLADTNMREKRLSESEFLHWVGTYEVLAGNRGGRA